MKFRIKHADKVVGFFVLFAMAVVLILIVVLASNQRWFSRNYYYESRFPTAGGIAAGNAISMKGFEIGKVERLSLNDENTVDVQFFIYEQYHEVVRKNSVLDLVTSSIGLGSSLSFLIGKSDELLPEHSFIPSTSIPEGQELVDQELVQIEQKDDTIGQALANINPMLQTATRTLTLLNRAIEGKGTGQLNDILANANTAIISLSKTVDEARTLIGGIADTVNENLPQTFEQLDGVMNQLSTVLNQVDTITANLKQTTDAIADPTGMVPKVLGAQGDLKDILEGKGSFWDGINSLMSSLNKAGNDVQNITSGLSSEIPKLSSLLLETRKAISASQDVLEGLRNNPLLKGGISEKVVQESQFQGMRQEEF